VTILYGFNECQMDLLALWSTVIYPRRTAPVHRKGRLIV